MFTVINDEGRPWNIKILRKGDKYGRSNCLTHEDERPLVEFYDALYGPEQGFDEEGQFVGRYYVETILGEDGYGSCAGGLCLDGGIPCWNIDAVSMNLVREYLLEATR